mmetsp:Transcript_5927/g.17827  ORF Transcript_5927/g.17827 Transcript_5927/m.17827 type:complete len:236 (-) Transcript_5927:794-1501(-)
MPCSGTGQRDEETFHSTDSRSVIGECSAIKVRWRRRYILRFLTGIQTLVVSEPFGGHRQVQALPSADQHPDSLSVNTKVHRSFRVLEHDSANLRSNLRPAARKMPGWHHERRRQGGGNALRAESDVENLDKARVAEKLCAVAWVLRAHGMNLSRSQSRVTQCLAHLCEPLHPCQLPFPPNFLFEKRPPMIPHGLIRRDLLNQPVTSCQSFYLIELRSSCRARLQVHHLLKGLGAL